MNRRWPPRRRQPAGRPSSGACAAGKSSRHGLRRTGGDAVGRDAGHLAPPVGGAPAVRVRRLRRTAHRRRLRGWNANDPLALLALRLLIDDNPDGTVRGVAMLAQRPNVAASLLPLLHENLRVRLESVPAIALDGADLPPSRSPAPVRRRRC